MAPLRAHDQDQPASPDIAMGRTGRRCSWLRELPDLPRGGRESFRRVRAASYFAQSDALSLKSGQPREPISHETASDRDVEAGSPAHHRNLDAFVDLGKEVVGNAVAKSEAPDALSKGSPQQIGCLLLARLAVDQTVQGCGLGAALLGDCLGRSAQLSLEVGLKALLVHCRDEAARDFYLSKADFLTSPIEDLQLLLPMKWILANVQQSDPAG